MLDSLHFISDSKNITIDVYRHTLFISINGPLNNDSSEEVGEVLSKYFEYVNYLNSNYEFWGEIISLNTEFVVSKDIAELFLSGELDVNTEKRKCIGISTIKNVTADSVSALSTFLPDVPFEIFKSLPEAMVWVDKFMNWFAVKHVS